LTSLLVETSPQLALHFDAMAELETVLTRRLEEVEAKGASYTKAFGGYGKVVNHGESV